MPSARATTAKRRMPVKKATFELDGDYEGFTVTVRLNPPFYVLTDLESGDVEKVLSAYAALILDWDFVDDEGEPLPKPNEGGVRYCSADLLETITDHYSEYRKEQAALPKN